MMTVLGLAVAGMGIGTFPRGSFKRLEDEGKLIEIAVTENLPTIPYAAMYKHNRPSVLIENVIKISQQVCNFTSQFAF